VVLLSGLAEDSAAIELRATPKLCLLALGEQACGGEVTLRWRSPQPISSCLYQDQGPEALRCWHQARSGELRLPLHARKNVTFLLVSPEGTPLAQTQVQVVLPETSQRRKRRNPWSFY
jgi:hypothetical protein